MGLKIPNISCQRKPWLRNTGLKLWRLKQKGFDSTQVSYHNRHASYETTSTSYKINEKRKPSDSLLSLLFSSLRLNINPSPSLFRSKCLWEISYGNAKNEWKTCWTLLPFKLLKQAEGWSSLLRNSACAWNSDKKCMMQTVKTTWSLKMSISGEGH